MDGTSRNLKTWIASTIRLAPSTMSNWHVLYAGFKCTLSVPHFLLKRLNGIRDLTSTLRPFTI